MPQSPPKFRKIMFEIGNVCNLQCSFCPEVGRTKVRVEEENFRRTLVELSSYTERVCFHLMGEPTAHPNFAKFVQIAQEVGVAVELTTNGTLMTDIVRDALLNPTVVQVNFSLQSFFDNFPSANPQSYLRKIFDFVHEAMQKRPDLYINFRLWNLGGDGACSTNEFLFGTIEEEFAVRLNRRVDTGFRKSKRVVGRLYLHFDDRFSWPSLTQPVRSVKGTCFGTREHIGIHADGTVVPCCLDKEADIALGNINQSSLQDILNSDRFLNMREGFEQGNLLESLCQRCDYVSRFG